MNDLIKQAKYLRSRKIAALEYYRSLCDLLGEMKEKHFTFCSKYTGEILRADEWIVFDEEQNRPQ